MKYLCLPLALLFLPTILFSQQRAADLVVVNAKVRTMTTSDSVAEAFAVLGDRVTDVGTNKEIKTHIGPATRVIDADGRLVLPGFNDAHVHFMAIGNTFSTLDLRGVRSAEEMLAKIFRYAKFLPKGRWILGGSWNNDGWTLPDRAAIEASSPDNPVLLYRATGTSAVASTFAFKIARLRDDRDLLQLNASGEPSGLIFGQTLKRVAAFVPQNHTTNWLEIAETATNYAASLGVTSVQDMHSDDSREIYLELERQGKLKTRVYDCVPLRDWSKLKASRIAAGRGSLVTDGCLKSFSNGDEAEKGALLSDVAAADKAGLQIMIHAIGAAANHIVLDVFEQALRTNGPRDRRFRVEHAHNASDADLPRFKRSNIIASMQPFLFAQSNGSHYGALLKQKAAVAFGSDASMVDLNPLLGIHAAVNNERESISVYDAVRAYTFGAAYAEFQEKNKGAIEPGKLADFVILSDDIFTVDRKQIRDTKIMMTVVGGTVVYQSN